jgi:hypothetical protein
MPKDKSQVMAIVLKYNLRFYLQIILYLRNKKPVF